MKKVGPSWLFLLLIVPILSGCPSRAVLGPVSIIYPDSPFIDIEVKSFSFQPNHIMVLQNQSAPITFRLINIAQIWHNFTLLDRHNDVIMSKDLTSKESGTLTIESLPPGNYVFYCNRFRHRRAGMEEC